MVSLGRKSILVMVTMIVMKDHDQKYLGGGGKGFISLTVP